MREKKLRSSFMSQHPYLFVSRRQCDTTTPGVGRVHQRKRDHLATMARSGVVCKDRQHARRALAMEQDGDEVAPRGMKERPEDAWDGRGWEIFPRDHQGGGDPSPLSRIVDQRESSVLHEFHLFTLSRR